MPGRILEQDMPFGQHGGEGQPDDVLLAQHGLPTLATSFSNVSANQAACSFVMVIG